MGNVNLLVYTCNENKNGGIGMLRVVICCGAGMSSSYLCQKLQNETKARGLENEVSFDFFSIDIGRLEAEERLKQYDVAMCCPHLKHFVDDFLKTHETNCAMYIFPPKMYGTLPFDEVLQDARDVYEEFQKTRMNPFHFPGEDHPLRIKRGVAYRNWKK